MAAQSAKNVCVIIIIMGDNLCNSCMGDDATKVVTIWRGDNNNNNANNNTGDNTWASERNQGNVLAI